MTVPTITPPTNTQTNRQDLNDLLAALIAAFIAAHPTVTRKFWSEVPASLTGEVPFVYTGPINEQIAHDSGTRGTLFTGELGYVDRGDPQEVNTRINTFADFMRDWFTANSRALPAGTFEQTAFIDGGELTQGNAVTANPKIAFRFFVQEGRS